MSIPGAQGVRLLVGGETDGRGPLGPELSVTARGHAASGLPVGTVTLLFGHVEGSVRQWSSGGGARAVAAARLDQVVSDCANRHGGARPGEQGGSDGFVVAFGRASDGLACAL